MEVTNEMDVSMNSFLLVGSREKRKRTFSFSLSPLVFGVFTLECEPSGPEALLGLKMEGGKTHFGEPSKL